MYGQIRVGLKVPNINLNGIKSGKDTNLDLKQNNSNWTLLFFYPSDFESESKMELEKMQNFYSQFLSLNCKVFAISTDSKQIHLAFYKSFKKLEIPLLSDKHHSASIDFNLFFEEEASSHRGSFLINPDGVLAWMEVWERNLTREIENTFLAIKKVIKK